MKKAILISITIASIILLFGYYNLMHRDNTNFEGDSTYIYINSSDSIVSIIDTINKKIKSPKTFLKAAKRMDYIENIKSGRFNILKGAGNKEIINSLKFNNTPLTVTFNNQERIHDLAGRVSKQILADSVSLLNAFEYNGVLPTIYAGDTEPLVGTDMRFDLITKHGKINNINIF